jgi:DNA-3-methyladenine glycosylase II
MSKRIRAHLLKCYPEAAWAFTESPLIAKLKPRDTSLAEAVVETVVGQMLSGKAADTIYSRLCLATKDRRLSGTWELGLDDLRACGLSRSKSRAILEFGEALKASPTLVDGWRELPCDEMVKQVKGFWGMSEWTATILALFYLGHEDVFPKGDSSLNRALVAIAKKTKRRRLLDPEKAAPYRSYLALYLWTALDSGVLR